MSFGETSVSYNSGLGGAVKCGFTFAIKTANSSLWMKSWNNFESSHSMSYILARYPFMKSFIGALANAQNWIEWIFWYRDIVFDQAVPCRTKYESRSRTYDRFDWWNNIVVENITWFIWLNQWRFNKLSERHLEDRFRWYGMYEFFLWTDWSEDMKSRYQVDQVVLIYLDICEFVSYSLL